MPDQLDLFTAQSSKNSKALTVSGLNARIKSQLETHFQTVWLRGEISNFKAHSSGHYYFSLKDDKSQISAVMFRGQNSKLKFRPKDGIEVLVKGRVTVYPPRGNYQILCESMEPIGAGGLKEEFERLKLKLKEEGLFDTAHKKPLPYLPFKIALVTSPTSAAVRDMIQVLNRRHPSAEVTVVPCLTQGEKASPDIIRALKKAEALKGVEIILLSRGGGSLEDMWCFNDETLARTIYDLKVPVISGVGHEIDFTIADFVADYRAPTPSAAAELACKNVEEIRERINQSKRRLYYKITQSLKNLQMKTLYLKRRLQDPRKRLDDIRLRAEELILRIEQSVKSLLQKNHVQLQNLNMTLNRFPKTFDQNSKELENLKSRLMLSVSGVVKAKQSEKKAKEAQLKALSPFGVLERGYAIVKDAKTNKVVKDKKSVKNNQELNIKFHKDQLKVKTILEDQE